MHLKGGCTHRRIDVCVCSCSVRICLAAVHGMGHPMIHRTNALAFAGLGPSTCVRVCVFGQCGGWGVVGSVVDSGGSDKPHTNRALLAGVDTSTVVCVRAVC